MPRARRPNPTATTAISEETTHVRTDRGRAHARCPPNPTTDTIRCPQCPAAFATERGRKIHIGQVHKTNAAKPAKRVTAPASNGKPSPFRWAVIVDTDPPRVVVLHLQADADAVVRLLAELGHTAGSAQLTG